MNQTVQCPQCGYYTQGSFCGRCGCEIKAPVKRERRWVWILVGGLILAMLFAAVAILFLRGSRPIPQPPGYDMPPAVSQPQKSGELPNGVSQDEYDQLSLGMTYAQASAIIGGDGTLLNSGENIRGEVYYIYGFPGEYNVDAVVYITISMDVITDISLEGSLE